MYNRYLYVYIFNCYIHVCSMGEVVKYLPWTARNPVPVPSPRKSDWVLLVHMVWSGSIHGSWCILLKTSTEHTRPHHNATLSILVYASVCLVRHLHVQRWFACGYALKARHHMYVHSTEYLQAEACSSIIDKSSHLLPSLYCILYTAYYILHTVYVHCLYYISYITAYIGRGKHMIGVSSTPYHTAPLPYRTSRKKKKVKQQRRNSSSSSFSRRLFSRFCLSLLFFSSSSLLLFFSLVSLLLLLLLFSALLYAFNIFTSLNPHTSISTSPTSLEKTDRIVYHPYQRISGSVDAVA